MEDHSHMRTKDLSLRRLVVEEGDPEDPGAEMVGLEEKGATCVTIAIEKDI